MKSFILTVLFFVISLATPLSVQAKSYWLTGAVAGGVVGTGAGVGLGLGYCTIAEENASKCRKIVTPISGVILGAAGAGIGALIGMAIHKKETAIQLTADPKAGLFGASFNRSF